MTTDAPDTPEAGGAPRPLRIAAGADLREALEALVAGQPHGAFVVAGIGSLSDARLRLAGRDEATLYPGPSEILTLCGSLASDGAHLHVSIATATGAVAGGHLVRGNIVRTTAEVLLMPLPAWRLSRVVDPATGYPELLVRPAGG